MEIKDNWARHRIDRKQVKGLIGSISILMIFLIFVLIAPSNKGIWTYPDVVLSTPKVLRGNATITEIAQDIYGFRALVYGLNPYANLHTAVPLIGAEWNDNSPTTHPPTAFLLVAPIALLPLRVAFSMWAWLMIGATIATMRAYHFSWQASVILGLLSMLWPPTITALGNFPCVWMLGLALAYRQRNRNPLLAGVWIGVASFTKLLPAVMLFPFLIKRKWPALAGFALSWGIALSLLSVCSPSVIARYWEANKIAAPSWIVWIGNASPLVFLFRNFGLAGLGVGFYILLLVFLLNWRAWLNQGDRITSNAWHLFSLFAVVLLPIAWTYSVAPLLPALLVLARSSTPKRLLGLLALAGPIIAVSLGLPSAGVVLMLLIPYCLHWILIRRRALHPVFSSSVRWPKSFEDPKRSIWSDGSDGLPPAV